MCVCVRVMVIPSNKNSPNSFNLNTTRHKNTSGLGSPCTWILLLAIAISIWQERRRGRGWQKGRKEGIFKWEWGQESGLSLQRRESVFCVLFPQSGPFTEEERGGPSVDLGCTKGALILSREPNQSTEEHVQKETSLSSTAIEPQQWTPQIKPWRESKARMWEMCFEICCSRKCRETGQRGWGHKNPSSAIGPISATTLKGS